MTNSLWPVSRYSPGMIGSTGSGQGTVAGSCEHGNKPSSFIKDGELLTS